MNILETAEAVTIEPATAATASVIWLHGLGADGHDFVPIVPELRLPDAAAIRFVFPHAPVRPVTINGGMPMRAWYDVLSLGGRMQQDEAGIEESTLIVRGLIAAEQARGVGASRIVLAGFSQGGAIALNTGLSFDERLAGILALSTYLPFPQRLASMPAANRELPILMCHGRFDPMLPQAMGEASCAALRAAGYAVEWHSYPMQHEVCMEEIADIAAWLGRAVP